MRIIFFLFLIYSFSFSYEKLYFLPSDSKEFQKDLKELIKNSETSIDIAMYNFSYKDFAKEIKKAVKDEVRVDIILDKKKIKDDESSFKYLKKHGANIIIKKDKMHIKAAMFDKKYIVFGSLNWSEKSFNSDTYDIVYISDDLKLIKKFEKVFDKLKK